MTIWSRSRPPPSLDDIAALGETALATIPEPLRAHVQGVVLRVDDFPDEETEREMDLESPFDLLGLYRGVALPHRSTEFTGTMPNMVFLYRRPLLEYWCETGEDLADVVRHVLIHEIGHHFGFSDDDMDALEDQD
jgi:predicted Zn-dependent protease with MMP-like domain